MSNTKPTIKRRTSEQWSEIMEQWRQSNLSAPKFCRQNEIGYAGFCQWRQRLTQNDKPKQDDSPAFIDLASISPSSSSAWHIVLSLGDSVELKLSRG